MRFFLRLLQYGRPFAPRLPLGILFLVLFNLFSAASLALVIPFLEILFAETAPANPGTVDIGASLASLNLGPVKQAGYFALWELMAEHGKQTVLLGFCGFVAVAIVLKNAFRYLSLITITPLEVRLVRNLRQACFDKLTHLSLGYYTRKRRGHLVNIMTSDLQNIQEAVTGAINSILSDPLMMLAYLLTMLAISWKLTLFILIVLPLSGLIIAKIGSSLKKSVSTYQTQLDSLMSMLDEFTGGVRVVKAFSAEGYVRSKYKDKNNEYTQTYIRGRYINDMASPLTEVLGVFVALGIILYGGNMILNGAGEFKASEFIGFILVFSQFLMPIKTFASAVSRVSKARVSYARIEGLLHEPTLPTEQELGRPSPAFAQGLSIRSVSFQYDSDRLILNNVSLDIRKGETVALVGSSGSGKSTLVDLICRFYDPMQGEILLDGQPLTTMDGTALRRLMGIVAQEGILFNDTIRNNIAYGATGYSDEDIQRAAEIANAHEFIQQLPNGYDTFIGERGLALSGGQRQRLSIARAVLRNPPILILDEATSALDNESERLVQQALDRLMEGRTVIVIAHRLSTVQHADRIAVMKDGQIVEMGTHTELVAKQGVYRRLYELQFQQDPNTELN